MYRLALLLLALAPAAAFAQGTGTVEGRVVDAAGESLPGANVLIGGTTLGAATGMDGAYRIVGVPLGAYGLTASYTGFEPVTQHKIVVGGGAIVQVGFVLEESKELDMVWCDCYYDVLVSSDPFVPRLILGRTDGPCVCGPSIGIADLPVGR
jgi:CarboxypepD_reg-like domain